MDAFPFLQIVELTSWNSIKLDANQAWNSGDNEYTAFCVFEGFLWRPISVDSYIALFAGLDPKLFFHEHKEGNRLLAGLTILLQPFLPLLQKIPRH